MDGITIIRVIRRIKIEIAVINETPDTTPLVTPAPQAASSPLSDMKKRCFNAFLILVSYTAGIGSIILGGTYINDCPDQNMLPIGLIIFGGILLVSRLLNCVYDCRSVFDEEDSENTPPCIQVLNVIFFLASFGMFIAVFHWTNSLNPTTKPEDRGLKNYCNYTLAYTAAWECIALIVFLVVTVEIIQQKMSCRGEIIIPDLDFLGNEKESWLKLSEKCQLVVYEKE